MAQDKCRIRAKKYLIRACNSSVKHSLIKLYETKIFQLAYMLSITCVRSMKITFKYFCYLKNVYTVWRFTHIYMCLRYLWEYNDLMHFLLVCNTGSFTKELFLIAYMRFYGNSRKIKFSSTKLKRNLFTTRINSSKFTRN